MNFGADHRVRDAFRANLIEEPSSPVLLETDEFDAADVLEVTDLAGAIARAEEALRARSSRILEAADDSGPDLFDALGAGTDDTVGPAVHVPYRPTPLPPAPEPTVSAPEPTAPLLPVAAPAPVAIPPAARTAPLLVIEDDAYYYPAGRIRTLADGTVETYRPEPTLLARLRARRSKLTWVVGAALAPLALLAVFAAAVAVGQASAQTPEVSTSVGPRASTLARSEVKPEPATASPAPTLMAVPVSALASAPDDIPVVDVSRLKSAPARRPRR